MTDDFDELEKIASAMMAQLSSGQRRSLLRKMARGLAISQRQRITAQKAPDGSAYPARKAKAPPIYGKGPACFLYPSGGSGPPRRVIMKSFAWTGDMMTGYDIHAGAIRSFERSKVLKWLPVPSEHSASGAAPRRGGLRRKTMFRKLAQSRHLKIETSDTALSVGFSGKVGIIASVHHHGLRDRPSLRAKFMDYPKRELLGATKADREVMMDILMAHFEGG